MGPVREWIRVDLPLTLLTAVSLLVRHALVLARKRLKRRRQHS